jgi:salicylate hydroxylase
MTRAIVIGGGIGGLTAAIAMRQRGLEVSVYESTPELREIGAGVALGPNAIKVMRGLGLEQETREISGRFQANVLRSWNTGRVISQTSQQQQVDQFGAAPATVHRADLLTVLARALGEDAVQLGRRCVGVENHSSTAVAHFEDGSQDEADVVVGADGIHSAVRAALHGADQPRFTGKICYRAVVDASRISGGPVVAESSQWLGPHGTIVLYPLRQNALVNIVCHYDDDSYKHESWVSRCEAGEVLERYGDWNSALLALFAGAELWYKWALYDREPLDRWTDGRITLLGDAAHPMLPYLGQGACQTLEDGYILAAALASETDVPSALELYERSRRPRANRVVLTARARGEDNHLVSPVAARRRDLAIAMRRRFGRDDPEGRGASWIPRYDATSPDALDHSTTQLVG